MRAAKVAITMDEAILKRLDRLVSARVFPNRSRAIQAAVAEKLQRLDQSRLARECAKLDRNAEQALAEEGMASEAGQWPAY
jgi:metal-responsive CopG/Arc/MetJ family transcriptional regulator